MIWNIANIKNKMIMSSIDGHIVMNRSVMTRSEADWVAFLNAQDEFRMLPPFTLDFDNMVKKYDNREYETHGYTKTYFNVDGIVCMYSHATYAWYIFRYFDKTVEAELISKCQ